VGIVNQKRQDAEDEEQIVARAEQAIQLFGVQRVLLNPDCGFATFADNPVAAVAVAEQKLEVLAQAAETLRQRHRT
jgi:5-methyltetrahydropteroyltriglutamate--homocysteine methyltransferase